MSRALLEIVGFCALACLLFFAALSPVVGQTSDHEISPVDYQLLDILIRDSAIGKSEACKALEDGKITKAERDAIFKSESERSRVADEAKALAIKESYRKACKP